MGSIKVLKVGRDVFEKPPNRKGIQKLFDPRDEMARNWEVRAKKKKKWLKRRGMAREAEVNSSPKS